MSVPRRDAQELFTIKLSPTEVKQVTEAEKFALKAAGTNFIDITNHPSLNPSAASQVPKANTKLPPSEFSANIAAVVFPTALTHQSLATPLLAQLSKDNLKSNLEPFSTFQNRFYQSTYGAESSAWLLKKVQDLIVESGATLASARQFNHSFTQSSVIATIPGASNRTIVMGAHQDSVNWRETDQKSNRAPGADDDGSGTVTILEALRVLLTNEDVKAGTQPNTIEFHWYAAEEGGLLGSSDVWASYKESGVDAKALLQQDMTGYNKGTTDKGKPDIVGVIVDYVDTPLTNFIKSIITEYCDIGYVETKCGYACSDHASASENGYPSSFIFESDFKEDNPTIHTKNDTIDLLDFDHMLEHAKLTLAFAVELGWTETFWRVRT
ncbi:Zn-dependent exopeptidase [Massarina eburnea CBS 473.64]|uniref:Peptide hydrolase n=1 Tax=Massarina eburnea CBS 473.64 TaxID=1395130 RepID=A0A6A6SCB0_9PLEO|nr:Zn-dependent exopeptidase [Massarina eburnea CBS 473.64]